jgi:hypothetical protein
VQREIFDQKSKLYSDFPLILDSNIGKMVNEFHNVGED